MDGQVRVPCEEYGSFNADYDAAISGPGGCCCISLQAAEEQVEESWACQYWYDCAWLRTGSALRRVEGRQGREVRPPLPMPNHHGPVGPMPPTLRLQGLWRRRRVRACGGALGLTVAPPRSQKEVTDAYVPTPGASAVRPVDGPDVRRGRAAFVLRRPVHLLHPRGGGAQPLCRGRNAPHRDDLREGASAAR
jgi:hypothetical protein